MAGQPGRTTILVGRLIDGTGAAPLSNAAVVVEDGRIASVLGEAGDLATPDAGVVLDRRDCSLVPGLIDAHAHLSLSPDLANDGDVASDLAGAAEVILLRAVRHARLALASGVTTVRDLGAPGTVTLRLRDAIKAGVVLGPRLLVAGRPITTTAGHGNFFGIRADGADEVRKAVRTLCEQGVDVIKVMVTGGMMTPGSNPRAVQFSDEELAIAVSEAHRLGRRVAGHVLCSAGVTAAIKAGIDTVEHCWTITGATQDYDPGIARALARSGSYGSVTAQRDVRALLPHRGNDVEELKRRLAPHVGMLEAGVPLVVHSDAGPPGTFFERFAESIEAFMLGLDVSVQEAVKAATGTAAKALGIDDEVGTIAVGKVADLVVLNGDVVEDIGALRSVREVLCAGVTVAESGALIERYLDDGETVPARIATTR